jgi:hypothetical protein
MSTLASLKKSISNMSDSEALELIMDIRKNRRKVKARAVAKKKSKAIDIGSFVKKMSPEMAKAMLKALQSESSN